MLFGYIHKDKNDSKPQKEIQRVLNYLLWDDNNINLYSYSCGSFNCMFFADRQLPEKKFGEVFFYDTENGILVIFDGYLYNQEEIIHETNIIKKDAETAEVIYSAYQKWDISFAEKLNGDFVVVIYFEKNHRTLFFRDHLGIRPLSIAFTQSGLYLATDPMGLCKALFQDKKIETEYLINFFLAKIRNYNLLPQKNIINIKPGHYLDFSWDNKEHKPYWHPERIKLDKKLTQTKVIEDLKKLVFDAVAIRSDSRFTASAHVSGGLDSGIIAVLSRKCYINQSLFYGYSWSPENEKINDKINRDERVLVKKICEQNDIMPTYTDINANDYFAFLANWRYPSEFIFEKSTLKKAKEKEINLIFSGWGGDEFISIGNYGIDSDLLRNYEWNYFLKKYSPRNIRNFLSILYHKVLVPSIKSTKSRIQVEEHIYPYIKDALKSSGIEKKKKLRIRSRRDFHLYFLERKQISARTVDWYVHGQRNGVEYRYPLLDKRIVEYMLKVPSRCLINGKKNRIILRELGKGFLPAELLSSTTKEDPVAAYRYKSIVKNQEESVKKEYLNYKNNPDLSFINFDLLDKQIKQLQDNPQMKNEKDSSIYYYLKWVHEFTKGYYGAAVSDPIKNPVIENISL